MNIKEIFNNLIEKELDIPIGVSKNILKFKDNCVKYYIDRDGIYTKTASNKKRYMQIMYGRKKPVKKNGNLKFFDIIDPECYENLSNEEKVYFYPVIKCAITSYYALVNTMYSWVSVDYLMYHNFGIEFDKEKLFTNDKICDKRDIRYPMPDNKYYPASKSRENFFNKK